MSTVAHREPLASFPLIRTGSVDILQDAVSRFYGDIKFSLPHGAEQFEGVANHKQLKDVGISYGANGAAVDIGLRSFNYYAKIFAFRGTAQATVNRKNFAVDHHRYFVGSAEQSIDIKYHRGFELIALKINPPALERKLEAFLEKPIAERIQFAHQSSIDDASHQHLHCMLKFFIARIEGNETPLHPWAVSEFEQALITTFICTHQHNLSRLLETRPAEVAPWQVRKAEEYIDAHWDQPITIEALAIITGVSTRSLFHSFQKSRGYSPMHFARQKRLEHARRMLIDPHLRASVTEVAFACGFGNLGHFANYYNRKFGELPSQTVRKAKGTVPPPGVVHSRHNKS